MHKIAIIGHFGFGYNLLNGQTIKTKIIADQLKKTYGCKNVKQYDTHGGIKFLLKMPLMLIMALATCNNIIIMPAHKGLRIMMPIIKILNTFYHRKIFYVVIGGWLPDMLETKIQLRSMLKNIDGIFVETMSMKRKMETMGFENCFVMPNCKPLKVTENISDRLFYDKIYLCTFSRVIKEKGIEYAIEAVKNTNSIIGYDIFCLDIYGQIDKKQEEWFRETIKLQPKYIQYCGCIEYNNSTNILEKYYALLFPTFYEGECFAGTIIDAFAAGLPVIASDWHDNKNIIKDEETGILFPVHSVKSLTNILYEVAKNPSKINKMRPICIKEAKKFQPEIVIQTLTSKLK